MKKIIITTLFTLTLGLIVFSSTEATASQGKSQVSSMNTLNGNYLFCAVVNGMLYEVVLRDNGVFGTRRDRQEMESGTYSISGTGRERRVIFKVNGQQTVGSLSSGSSGEPTHLYYNGVLYKY